METVVRVSFDRISEVEEFVGIMNTYDLDIEVRNCMTGKYANAKSLYEMRYIGFEGSMEVRVTAYRHETNELIDLLLDLEAYEE